MLFQEKANGGKGVNHRAAPRDPLCRLTKVFQKFVREFAHVVHQRRQKCGEIQAHSRERLAVIGRRRAAVRAEP